MSKRSASVADLGAPVPSSSRRVKQQHQQQHQQQQQQQQQQKSVVDDGKNAGEKKTYKPLPKVFKRFDLDENVSVRTGYFKGKLAVRFSGRNEVECQNELPKEENRPQPDRKSTRLNSSHLGISYAVFCLKKK